jgi:hypothetical protein
MQDDQLIRAERKQRVRPTIVVAELHLEDMWRQLLDNRANLAAAEAVIGDSFEQCDNIEELW